MYYSAVNVCTEVVPIVKTWCRSAIGSPKTHDTNIHLKGKYGFAHLHHTYSHFVCRNNIVPVLTKEGTRSMTEEDDAEKQSRSHFCLC